MKADTFIDYNQQYESNFEVVLNNNKLQSKDEFTETSDIVLSPDPSNKADDKSINVDMFQTYVDNEENADNNQYKYILSECEFLNMHTTIGEHTK